MTQQKENFEQLKYFDEVQHTDLKEGDHFRYTHDKYKEYGRSCKYGVVFEITDENEIIATTLKPQEGHEPFELFSTNRYKNYRFYKNNNPKKFQDLDTEATTAEEQKKILKDFNVEVKHCPKDKLKINELVYISNMLYKKTTRTIKKHYLCNISPDTLTIKNSPDSPKSRNIKIDCIFKKYLTYQ